MPTLNERDCVEELTLIPTINRTTPPHTVIADGGSTDGIVEFGKGLQHTKLASTPGRARQMNAAAQLAETELLLFTHADTRIDDPLKRALLTYEGYRQNYEGILAGHFPLRFIKSKKKNTLYFGDMPKKKQ
ncbi:MAG: hypothetical protein R2827_02195 [Bdellovibrionales bacterium]